MRHNDVFSLKRAAGIETHTAHIAQAVTVAPSIGSANVDIGAPALAGG